MYLILEFDFKVLLLLLLLLLLMMLMMLQRRQRCIEPAFHHGR